MGQLRFTISIIMISLFTIAIIGFAVQFASDNGTSISLADDPELVNLGSNADNSLGELTTESESGFKSIVGSSITKGDTLESGGALSLTTETLITSTTNILSVGYSRIFGNAGNFGIFFTTLVSILLFIGTMYLLKTWLGRNPD